ncbi:putative MFS-type transporter EfpA [Mycobacterium marinum]|uniref:MFS transporter n=1 Tax=Mycobacterium marinum TaxID=1781 RepID=UPI0021C37DD3|nr:MFS transporter [Mycobacterium marinum]GJO04538.1 putative MFS-type transporter EfpA [Mycobacterium marinum]GJO07661.1 putative MFS-type transporter EfpA [Mycobacterium marinum]GJO08143.1 putative MFS-type transporter EfpA [Mycobacterium marinum]GJO21336.1 putative MFS-type transporter EfpA [Mycobacterium marinum]GJO22940.1 putative MFS-type transporter EfpA [Mycobacterium marinum]
MTALNDTERAVHNWTSGRQERLTSARATRETETASERASRYYPTWLPSRRFIAAVIAIGGMQLLATMDSTVAIVALPKIQDELSLSDAGRSWVITAYVLTFGGLMLLGGRLGDTIGRKRTFIVGVALFTISSVLCAVAWDEATLVIARLSQGVGSAIASPTGLALVATTFPKGPARNAATAVFAAMTAVGSVMGLVVGGALTEVSWRLAFMVNVPIGLVMIYLARTALRETNRERMKLDAAGAILATLACTAAVFAFSMGPEKGWLSITTIGSGAVAFAAALGFVLVERTAENPVVPFDLFHDRNRLVTFIAIFLAGGVMFSLTVCIGLYVQDVLGYSALRAGVGFIPFVIAMGIGLGVSSQLVSRFSPRVLTIGGGYLLVCAMIYGWAFMQRGVPYFPNLVAPIVIGGIGIGMAVVPLTLAAIAGVGFDRIGPVSALTLMLQSLGGPLVLAVIQAVITSRTLYLGGTTGPVKFMNDAQLHALDHGYTYGLLWVAGAAVIVGGAAVFIGYTPEQVAHAQEVKEAIDAGEL